MNNRGRPSRATVYARLDAAIAEFHERLGGLPSPTESEAIWADIWHQEAHHSTALEGNTLILREVEKLLDDGRAVGAKPLKEYLEVKGYADAARWVYAQALEPDEWTDGALINLQELRRIHHLAITPPWDVEPHSQANDAESPGNFRRHDILPFPAGMRPPPWTLVEVRTATWVDQVNDAGSHLRRSDAEEPFPQTLARLHNALEQVHPFLDGNGRTGRLALNLILVRLGYPPVIIFKRQPLGHAEGRRRRLRCARRTHCPRHVRQPQPLHRAERCRPRAAGSPGVAGRRAPERRGAPAGRPTREARGHPWLRRYLAQFAAGSKRIPAHQEEPTAQGPSRKDPSTSSSGMACSARLRPVACAAS